MPAIRHIKTTVVLELEHDSHPLGKEQVATSKLVASLEAGLSAFVHMAGPQYPPDQHATMRIRSVSHDFLH
jgi:hypothetical protein